MRDETLKGLAHQLSILMAGMAIHAMPSFACSIAFPSCVSEFNGRESQRVDDGQESQDVSIFVERSLDNESLAKLFLVNCRSRQGVWADLPEGADFQTLVLKKSVDYLIEAASSDRKYSLNEIKDFLTAEGLLTRVNRLPDGHCGCTLPVLDVPACLEESSG